MLLGFRAYLELWFSAVTEIHSVVEEIPQEDLSWSGTGEQRAEWAQIPWKQ